MGTLYYGDNLDILRRDLDDETTDLVYPGKSGGSERPSTVAPTH